MLSSAALRVSRRMGTRSMAAKAAVVKSLAAEQKAIADAVSGERRLFIPLRACSYFLSL